MSTIAVTDSYTLKRGAELDFTDEFGFLLTGSGSPSLTVGGTLKVTNSDAGFIRAIHVNDTVVQATIAIQKSGVVSVVATGDDCSAQAAGLLGYSVVTNAGDVEVSAGVAWAEGFNFVSGGSLVNSGVIHVSTQDLATIVRGSIDLHNTGTMSAEGVSSLGGEIDGAVDNSGTVTVEGTESAIAFTVHGDVHNSGTITASSEAGVAAGLVWWGEGHVLENDGTIIASSSGDAVAIEAHTIEGGPQQVIDNSGLLQAHWALTIIEPESNGSSVVFNNAGRVLGDIGLTSQSDELHNTGKITGTVWLGEGDDSFETSGKGKLTGSVFGGGGSDLLVGGKGNQTLVGDAYGDSTVTDGADTLIGGAGADTLLGGVGANVFVFQKLDDSSVAKADTIVDLQAEDLIDLHRIDADLTAAGNQSFHLVAKLTGHAGEAALVYDAANDETRLQLDVDGDGRADALVRIAGDHRDFVSFVL